MSSNLIFLSNTLMPLDFAMSITHRLVIPSKKESGIGVCSSPALFFKNNVGELHTPIPDSFLDGITRRCVIDIAKSKGIKVVERKIKLDDMSSFVGCFLTGTAAEVTPVASIDKYNFKVCNVIKDLSDSYQGIVRKAKNAA